MITTIIIIAVMIMLFRILESVVNYYMIEKHKPYEIETCNINGKQFLDVKFKEHTSLSISGDVELLINGDMFLINNGKFCVLTKDDIYMDGKQLFLQCRDNNPLLKKYKTIKREIEKNDFYLLQLEREKQKEK